MNLLEKRKQNYIIDDNIITINNFRQKQYDLLPDFCQLFVDYISQQNNNYLKALDISIDEKVEYVGMYNSQLSTIKIITNNYNSTEGEQKSTFLKMYIPTLIDGYLFYLNGNYYTPTIYASDLPIVIKKKSIKLTGLFTSITIYTKRDIAIFTGVNIPLEHFFQFLFMYDDDGYKLYNDYVIKFNLNHNKHSNDELITYFSNIFKCNEDYNEIIANFNKLFLDTYTYNLYKYTYEIEEPNIIEIVKLGLNKFLNSDSPCFIDLTHKRLIFIELLLKPILDRVIKLALEARKGYTNCDMRLNQLALYKYFLTSNEVSQNQQKSKTGLSGNFLYNTNNLYSGVLKYRISMVSPNMESPPKEIQNIHETHYGKICPISISSQKPGQTVSIIPNTKLDHFGRFII